VEKGTRIMSQFMIPKKYTHPATKPNQSDSFHVALWIATRSGTNANHESDQRLNSGNPKTSKTPDKTARMYL